jgi:hypothetical protein
MQLKSSSMAKKNKENAFYGLPLEQAVKTAFNTKKTAKKPKRKTKSFKKS